MNEKEYIEKVELLLSSLPAAEKEEALEYVREYLEEARLNGESCDSDRLPSPEEFVQSLQEEISRPAIHSSGSADFISAISRKLPPEIPDQEKLSSSSCSFASADDSYEQIFSTPVYTAASVTGGSSFRTAVIILAVIFSPVIVVLFACAVLAALMLVMAAILLFAALVLFGLMLVLGCAVFAVSILMLIYKGILLLSIDPAGTLFVGGLALICTSLSIASGILSVYCFKNWIPWAWKALGRFCLVLFECFRKMIQSAFSSFRNTVRKNRHCKDLRMSAE